MECDGALEEAAEQRVAGVGVGHVEGRMAHQILHACQVAWHCASRLLGQPLEHDQSVVLEQVVKLLQCLLPLRNCSAAPGSEFGLKKGSEHVWRFFLPRDVLPIAPCHVQGRQTPYIHRSIQNMPDISGLNLVSTQSARGSCSKRGVELHHAQSFWQAHCSNNSTQGLGRSLWLGACLGQAPADCPCSKGLARRAACHGQPGPACHM